MNLSTEGGRSGANARWHVFERTISLQEKRQSLTKQPSTVY